MDSYLQKYNPETSIFQNFQIPDGLSDADRAFKTWEALLVAKRSHDGLFLVIGKLLKDVRDQELWKFHDYDNFTQFLGSEELGFSREKAFMCIRTYEYYIEYLQLNPESVGKMNLSRLSMMMPVLKKIEDKTEAVKQIESFQSLRHGDFVREVKARTNRDGKPSVYFSEENDKWIVDYYNNTTLLNDRGEFTPVQEGEVAE